MENLPSGSVVKTGVSFGAGGAVVSGAAMTVLVPAGHITA